MTVKNISRIPNNNIILIGFMGSGKSTIGSALAKQLNMNFVDTDDIIEQNEKMSINQIFEILGEQKFRQLESDYIIKLSQLTNTVIATGGGMPCFEDNISALKKIGLVIYLKVGVNTLLVRISISNARPLMNNNPKPTITKMLKIRRNQYTQANLTVLGSRTKKQIIDRIVYLLNRTKS